MTLKRLYALFDANAPWPRVAGRTHVFKFYTQWIDQHHAGTASDAELRREIAALKARDIAIAVEFGPLTPEDGCGQGVEGFMGGAEQALLVIRRIASLGGKIYVVGGSTSADELDTNLEYDSAANAWTPRAVLGVLLRTPTALVLSLVLGGATFVGIQIYEYIHLVEHGFTPSGVREGSELAALVANARRKSTRKAVG